MTEIFYTKDQIDSLVCKFKYRSLAKAGWTHEAHLTIAIENTSKSGYHETLTIFWSKIIFLFIQSNKNLPIEQLVNKFLNSELADKNLPYGFYQKDDLFSALARSIYTEPTLKKLDESAIA